MDPRPGRRSRSALARRRRPMMRRSVPTPAGRRRWTRVGALAVGIAALAAGSGPAPRRRTPSTTAWACSASPSAATPLLEGDDLAEVHARDEASGAEAVEAVLGRVRARRRAAARARDPARRRRLIDPRRSAPRTKREISPRDRRRLRRHRDVRVHRRRSARRRATSPSSTFVAEDGRRDRRLHDAELRRLEGPERRRADPDADGRPARPAARRASGKQVGREPRSQPPTSAAEPLVLVEGVPSYYPQFGFVSATELGLERPGPDGSPTRAWMARAARAPTTRRIRGRVVYPAFFPPPPGCLSCPRSRRVRRAIAPALEGRTLEHVEIDDVRLTRPEDPLAGRRGADRRARRARRPARQVPDRPLRVRPRAPDPPADDRQPAARARRDARTSAPCCGSTTAREVGYRDVRRFGTWLLLEPGELEPYLGARLGEEPLVAAFTAKGLGERLRGPPRAAEGRPARPADARRAREHLRRRGALVRDASTRCGRQARSTATSCAACTARSGRRSSSGSRARARRSPTTGSRTARSGSMQQEFRAYGRTRRAVRPLRHAAREDPRRRPRHLVLPALSAALKRPVASSARTC